MEIVFVYKKHRKKIVFDSEYYSDKDKDVIKIGIPEGDIIRIIEIDKKNVRSIEKFSKKGDNKRKVVNTLTQF